MTRGGSRGGYCAEADRVSNVADYTAHANRNGANAGNLKELGTQAAGISHDLVNLLMVVSQQLKFARAEFPSKHQALDSLELAADATEQASNVVDLLRAFAKGTLPDKAPINLSQWLPMSARFFPPTLPDAIEFVTDVQDGSSIWIEGDATQLRRALTNLIANARDAMLSGGKLHLSLRSRPVRSDNYSDRSGTEAVVSISDTGTGMSAETLAEIFTPFYTTKPAGYGTGLGMVIVRNIVAAHQGRIEVQSKPGCGTCVEISIPCRQLTGIAEPVSSQTSTRCNSSRPRKGTRAAFNGQTHPSHTPIDAGNNPTTSSPNVFSVSP